MTQNPYINTTMQTGPSAGSATQLTVNDVRDMEPQTSLVNKVMKMFTTHYNKTQDMKANLNFRHDYRIAMGNHDSDDFTFPSTYNTNVKFRALVKGMERPRKHRFLCFGKVVPQVFFDVPDFPAAC